MDVNQKRQPSSNLRRLIKPLIFKGNRIELLGSAGLQSQQYYSDYDLYSVIKQKLTPDEAFHDDFPALSIMYDVIDNATEWDIALGPLWSTDFFKQGYYHKQSAL